MSEEKKWSQHEINEDLAKGIEKLNHKLAKLEQVQEKHILNTICVEECEEYKGYLKKEISEIKLNQTDGTPNQNFIAIRILKDGMNTIGIKIENRFNKIKSVLRSLGEDYIGHVRQGHPTMVVLGDKGWLEELDGEMTEEGNLVEILKPSNTHRVSDSKPSRYKLKIPSRHHFKTCPLLDICNYADDCDDNDWEHCGVYVIQQKKPSRCEKCGSSLVMDIATLNKGDPFCPKCFPNKKQPSEPDQEIPNYWKALINSGKMTKEDYFEKVIPCDILIQRAKKRLKKKMIAEFLDDLKELYNKGTDIIYYTLREKWQKKRDEK